jgi:hypothetical protein
VIQVSRDRFCALFRRTLMGAWYMVPSLHHQIRADGPVAPVQNEGLAMADEPDWRPFGIPLYRRAGFAFAYGVPKGAKRPDGSVFPNENVSSTRRTST